MTTRMIGAIRARHALLRAFAGDGARLSWRVNTPPRVPITYVQDCSRAQRSHPWSAVNEGLFIAVMVANLLVSAPAYSQQQTIVVPPQVIMWVPRGHGSNWFEGRPTLEPGEYGTAEDAAAASCASTVDCPYRVESITPVSK